MRERKCVCLCVCVSFYFSTSFHRNVGNLCSGSWLSGMDETNVLVQHFFSILSLLCTIGCSVDEPAGRFKERL